jgi:hypothetical protein
MNKVLIAILGAALVSTSGSFAIIGEVVEGTAKLAGKIVCVPIKVVDKVTGEHMTICKGDEAQDASTSS